MHEFTPRDFEDFVNDPQKTEARKHCINCLLFNFEGAIPPVIQEVIADAHDSENNDVSGHQCDSCPLTEREQKLTTLLLIDSLL